MSLFPIATKIFENAIDHNLLNYIEHENLLNINQSGFCANDSCINHLISIFIDISSISSSFKNLPTHLKVELFLSGDSILPAINNNLILKPSIKYIMTTNRFSVPLL